MSAAALAPWSRPDFVGATTELLQAVDNDLRRIGVALVSGKGESDNALNGSFPVRDIGSHTPRYVRKRVPDCMI